MFVKEQNYFSSLIDLAGAVQIVAFGDAMVM